MLFEDLPALFGSPLPKDGLMVRESKDAVHTEKYQSKCFIMMFSCVCVCVWKGVLVVSRPLNGCTTMDPAPPLPPSYDANTTKLIALIRRYDCNFDLKVSNVWLILSML